MPVLVPVSAYTIPYIVLKIITGPVFQAAKLFSSTCTCNFVCMEADQPLEGTSVYIPAPNFFLQNRRQTDRQAFRRTTQTYLQLQQTQDETHVRTSQTLDVTPRDWEVEQATEF